MISKTIYPIKLTVLFVSCTLLVLLVISSSFARTLKIGRQEAVFRTLQSALHLAAPGDTLLVGSGIYHEQLSIDKSGSPGRPVVIIAEHAGTAIIQGTLTVDQAHDYNVDTEIRKIFGDSRILSPEIIARIINSPRNPLPSRHEPDRAHSTSALSKTTGQESTTGLSQVTLTGSNLDFVGMVVKNSNGTGITTYGDNVRVFKCDVRNSYGHGIRVNKGSGCVVESCTVVNNSYKDVSRTRTSGGWGMGMSFYASRNGKAIGNKVFLNNGEGIGLWGNSTDGGCVGIELRGNVLWDNFSVQMWVDHGANVTMEGNFAFTTGNQPNISNWFSTPSGILIAEEKSFGHSGDLHDGLIKNNIITQCRSAFKFWLDGAGSGVKNYKILNNTFAYNFAEAIIIDEGANHSNSLIMNNILVQSIGAPYRITDTVNIKLRNNCYYSEDSTTMLWTALKPDGIHADPSFVSKGTEPQNFKLSPLSPCIDKGIVTSDVTLDFFGIRRPTATSMDIGAIEYDGPPTDNLPTVETVRAGRTVSHGISLRNHQWFFRKRTQYNCKGQRITAIYPAVKSPSSHADGFYIMNDRKPFP
jgi:parallel beta-helix repeat protein